MKKRALCLLAALCLLVPVLCAQAYDPIYVDGNGNILTTTPTPAPAGSSSSSGSSSGSSNSGVMAPVTDTPTPTDDPNAIPNWYYESTVLTAAWKDQRVTVQTLGTVVSTIKTEDGSVKEVSTNALTFDVEVAEDHRLAIVTPESSATVRLLKKAKAGSVVLNRVPAGCILPVLAYGKNYTLVHYDDCIGYVKTSVLTFSAPASEPTEMAYVAYNGKTSSRSTVKVRQKPSANSRILTELKCGTHVAVFSTEDKWTEIEAGGYHCWILSEFLTTVDS